MTHRRLRNTIKWFSLLTVTLILVSSCALFQPRDCETDELPDEILKSE